MAGFTLLELLAVIAIISILAAIAIMQFSKFKTQAYDTAAKSDLKNAMTALENYFIENNDYPVDKDGVLASGLNLSKDVCFTRYSKETFNGGEPTVHMHVKHAVSPNAWHAQYPEEGSNIEIRTGGDSCL